MPVQMTPSFLLTIGQQHQFFRIVNENEAMKIILNITIQNKIY